MTEKTILQQISNLVFDIQNTDDLQVIFDRADEILELTNQYHQPTFEVGEYLAESLSNVVKLLRAMEGESYTVEKEQLYTMPVPYM